MNKPLERLRHHVTGAIARGEAEPIVGVRPLYEIAAEIRRDWRNPYFGAVPYLDAMGDLTNITDNYFADTGRTVVLYFLANATKWRGEVARRVKAELKGLLK